MCLGEWWAASLPFFFECWVVVIIIIFVVVGQMLLQRFRKGAPHFRGAVKNKKNGIRSQQTRYKVVSEKKPEGWKVNIVIQNKQNDRKRSQQPGLHTAFVAQH